MTRKEHAVIALTALSNSFPLLGEREFAWKFLKRQAVIAPAKCLDQENNLKKETKGIPF